MMTAPSVRIAFLTHSGRPELTRDDAVNASELERLGATVSAVPWDGPDATDQLLNCDAAVFRSTWNYTEHCPKFLSWIDAATEAGVLFLNHPSIVRWNADKIYLADLDQRGHKILPTRWIDRGSTVDLAQAIAALDCDRVIVKPRISATAKGLFKTSLHDAARDQSQLDALLQEHDVMLQPFADEITEHGEWSLLYFDHHYSHAVIKRAKPGEHRVQDDFGGTHALATAPDALLDAAQALLQDCAQHLGEHIHYARVDGIERDGQLVLMELELIEPDLFVSAHPEAPTMFAQALLTAIQR